MLLYRSCIHKNSQPLHSREFCACISTWCGGWGGVGYWGGWAIRITSLILCKVHSWSIDWHHMCNHWDRGAYVYHHFWFVWQVAWSATLLVALPESESVDAFPPAAHWHSGPKRLKLRGARSSRATNWNNTQTWSTSSQWPHYVEEMYCGDIHQSDLNSRTMIGECKDM